MLDVRQLRVQFLDSVGDLAHFLDQRFGQPVVARLLERGDGLRDRVAAVFQGLDLGDRRESLLVGGGEPVDELRIDAAEQTFLADQFQVFPDKA